MGGHVEILKAILRQGADVNAQEHWTALHAAARYDQVGAIDTLIKAGADIERKDTDGCTALSSAAAERTPKAVLTTLLQNGATPTTRNNQGRTPLHRAWYWKHRGMEVVVDLLLRWGADETATTNAGGTPLQELDRSRRVDCSQEELDRTRLLLSRAPADRAWRRRCWLVILRSRAEKARRAISCDIGARGDGTGAGFSPAHGQQGGGCKLAKGGTGRGVEGGVRLQNNGVGGRRDEVDDSCLSDVTALVVGLEPESVFRSIVGFL